MKPQIATASRYQDSFGCNKRDKESLKLQINVKKILQKNSLSLSILLHNYTTLELQS